MNKKSPVLEKLGGENGMWTRKNPSDRVVRNRHRSKYGLLDPSSKNAAFKIVVAFQILLLFLRSTSGVGIGLRFRKGRAADDEDNNVEDAEDEESPSFGSGTKMAGHIRYINNNKNEWNEPKIGWEIHCDEQATDGE